MALLSSALDLGENAGVAVLLGSALDLGENAGVIVLLSSALDLCEDVRAAVHTGRDIDPNAVSYTHLTLPTKA